MIIKCLNMNKQCSIPRSIKYEIAKSLIEKRYQQFKAYLQNLAQMSE